MSAPAAAGTSRGLRGDPGDNVRKAHLSSVGTRPGRRAFEDTPAHPSCLFCARSAACAVQTRTQRLRGDWLRGTPPSSAFPWLLLEPPLRPRSLSHPTQRGEVVRSQRLAWMGPAVSPQTSERVSVWGEREGPTGLLAEPATHQRLLTAATVADYHCLHSYTFTI